ncbi:MAG: diguanylate cyclase [Burkholderiales bacterium]|nr:diguanylate cyclase [Burkholderiales bacterium]
MRFGIRWKMTVLFAAGFFIMAAAGLLLLRQSLIPSFTQLEQGSARSDAARMIASIDAELGYLDTLVLDWANWNDLYEYVQSPNNRFVDANLVPESLRNSSLSLVLIADTRGRIIRQDAIDERYARPIPIPLTGRDGEYILRLMLAQGPSSGCGFANTAVGLMALCWRPILRSDFTGPSVGKLVMGRLLSETRWNSLRQRTDLNFIFRNTPSPATIDERWPLPNHPGYIATHDIDVHYTQRGLIIDYGLEDLAGKHLGCLQLVLERTIYLQGQNVLKRSAILLALVMAAAVGLLIIAMKYWFVDPVRRLEAELATIRLDQHLDKRLGNHGQDEVGHLAEEINGLLRVIEMQVEQLEQLSSTDSLTALANRRAFDTRIDEELARHRRNRGPMALMLIDIDFFKQYNDHYGHPAGDHVLRRLAGVLNGAVNRQTDHVSRLGGEEFAVLLPQTDATGAEKVAARLQRNLAEQAITHAYGLSDHHLTISIGIAVMTDMTESAESLISRADHALYQAKANGRNRYELG